MDHLDQRGGPDHGGERVKHQRCERVKRVAKEPVGARQPAVSCSVVGTLWLRPRLGDDRSMVPGQHEQLSGIGRNHGTEVRRTRLGLFARDSNGIARRVQGLARVGNGGAVALGDPGEKPRQFRAHVCDGAQSAMRRASGSSFTQHVAPHGELVVEGSGLLTGVMGGVRLWETLVQMGRAFGTGKLGRRVVFLTQGGRGFALQWLEQLAEVSPRVAILCHPQRPVARGLGAGPESPAPIRGPAKADDMGRLQRFTMRSPGLSRPL